MLFKLFGAHKTRSSATKPARANPEDPHYSSPLRIVHAGGLVECYYLAVPAAGIMLKYPSAVLARPDVFQRPWESLVLPEEILTPGEKLYVVPRHTLRKLQRRIRRQATDAAGDSSNGRSSTTREPRSRVVSEVTVSSESESNFDLSDQSFTTNSSRRTSSRDVGSSAVRKIQHQQARATRRRRSVRTPLIWRPTLRAIDEKSPLKALDQT